MELPSWLKPLLAKFKEFDAIFDGIKMLFDTFASNAADDVNAVVEVDCNNDLVCISFSRNGSSSCELLIISDAFDWSPPFASADNRPVAAVICIDDVDDDLLYVLDVLPNLTTVFSLFARDDTKMGVLESDGMSQMTRMAIRANTEPNKNGGPGKRCFKIRKDCLLKRTNTFSPSNNCKHLQCWRMWLWHRHRRQHFHHFVASNHSSWH